MNLVLKIVNNPKEAINAASYEFKKQGGTIGRGGECTWVLNDKTTTLSTLHAEIVYKGGNYYLIDLSTNGIAYKRENRLVPPGELVLLHESELLSMGPYEILVGFVKSSNPDDALAKLLNQRELDVAIEENLLLKKEGNPALEVIMKKKVEEKSILEFANASGGGEEMFIGEDAFDDVAVEDDIYTTHISPPSFKEEALIEKETTNKNDDLLIKIFATKLGINLKNMSQEQQIVVLGDIADGLLAALETTQSIESNAKLIEKKLEKPNMKIEIPTKEGSKAKLNNLLFGSNETVAENLKKRTKRVQSQHTALYQAVAQQSESLQKEFSPNSLILELHRESFLGIFSRDASIWRAYMSKYAYLNEGCFNSSKCISRLLFERYKEEKERLALSN